MRKNNTRSPEEKEIIGYGLVSRRGAARSYYDGLNQVLNKIKEESNNEPIILHTDQGGVYSSISYKIFSMNLIFKDPCIGLVPLQTIMLMNH